MRRTSEGGEYDARGAEDGGCGYHFVGELVAVWVGWWRELSGFWGELISGIFGRADLGALGDDLYSLWYCKCLGENHEKN